MNGRISKCAWSIALVLGTACGSPTGPHDRGRRLEVENPVNTPIKSVTSADASPGRLPTP